MSYTQLVTKTDLVDLVSSADINTLNSNIISIIGSDSAPPRTMVGLDASISNIEGGWISAGETWTYASADDPTYTLTIPGDVTTKYSEGMKLKLKQTTNKYFFISSSPNYASGTGLTTITLYGGTDYDLSNATITDNYYALGKTPYGFPVNPTKWTIEITDATEQLQSNPTQNTWYNVGSLSISVPIGIWDIYYSANLYLAKTSASVYGQITLSTTNNSESDTDMTAALQVDSNGWCTLTRKKILSVASKTLYYLNERTTTASAGYVGLESGASYSKAIIRARYANL